MKHLLFILFMLITSITYSQQTIDLDAIAKVPKTEQQLIGKSKATQDQAIYKGKKYPVYVSERGKKFIVYVNRNGKPAKKYLPA